MIINTRMDFKYLVNKYPVLLNDYENLRNQDGYCMFSLMDVLEDVYLYKTSCQGCEPLPCHECDCNILDLTFVEFVESYIRRKFGSDINRI